MNLVEQQKNARGWFLLRAYSARRETAQERARRAEEQEAVRTRLRATRPAAGLRAVSDGDVLRLAPREKPGVRACRVCGCTQRRACPGGCSWVEWDLCSACVDSADA